MENAKLDLTSVRETEQELLKFYTPDFRGLAPGPAHRGAHLFAKVDAEFKAAQGKVKVLDVLTFEDCMAKF